MFTDDRHVMSPFANVHDALRSRRYPRGSKLIGGVGRSAELDERQVARGVLSGFNQPSIISICKRIGICSSKKTIPKIE